MQVLRSSCESARWKRSTKPFPYEGSARRCVHSEDVPDPVTKKEISYSAIDNVAEVGGMGVHPVLWPIGKWRAGQPNSFSKKGTVGMD